MCESCEDWQKDGGLQRRDGGPHIGEGESLSCRKGIKKENKMECK